MYYKFLEAITTILMRRRIRHVEWVGRAATIAKEGNPEKALAHLDEIEDKIHPKVRSVHAFTRAKILDIMGREAEAESEMIRAAKIDPSNFLAHLEIAKMCGRRFHFENAKARLKELSAVGDTAIKEQAVRHIAEIEDILSGKTETQFAKRAEKLAVCPLGADKMTLGLPVDLVALDRFIASEPETATAMLEDLSILLGQSAVISGGSWKISLSLRHCLVCKADCPDFNPFKAIAYRLAGDDISILKFPPSYSK